MSKFWMVYGPFSNGSPTKQHETIESAQAEAERLSRKHNDRFVVLEAIKAVTPSGPPVSWEELR